MNITVTVQHTPGKHLVNFTSKLKLLFLAYTSSDITLIFDDDSKYDLDGVDQYDWNKVIGRGSIAYKGNVHKNEDLITWRYIKETNEFHVADNYKRRNYNMQLPRKRKVIYDKGEIKVSRIFINNWIKPLVSWFGGNKTPNKVVKYKIKFHF